MDERNHAEIDVRMLADSVTDEFKTLHPLSNRCCIYRIPQGMRSLHPSDYTPKMVSIGPLHHNGELKTMEEHKIRYVSHFLQRRTKVSVEVFLRLIKVKEAELRNCYAETIAFNSDDFAKMIFVDAIFLLEFFLRGCFPAPITNDDILFGNLWIFEQLFSDLWLLENQIPLFILTELFDLAKLATYYDYSEGLSFIRIARWFSKGCLSVLPIDEDLLETKFSEAEHFLDLLRLCFQPPESSAQSVYRSQKMPGAKELHQSGVKFNMGTSKNPLDIKFDKGVLKIPFLTIYDNTETFYRNVLAFESMHGYTSHFNDYIIIMSYLVHTPEDGELLIQNGIIGLGNSERLSNVFHSLIKECHVGKNFGYSYLVEDLQSYCKLSRHKWKANLKQNYFNTPWAAISVAGAVVLLVLTLIQTTCSVIAL